MRSASRPGAAGHGAGAGRAPFGFLLPLCVAGLLGGPLAGNGRAEPELWLARRNDGEVVRFGLDSHCITAVERTGGQPERLAFDTRLGALLIARPGGQLEERPRGGLRRRQAGLLLLDAEHLTRRELLRGYPVVDGARLADGRLVAVLRNRSLGGDDPDAVVFLEPRGYRVLRTVTLPDTLDPQVLLHAPGRAASGLVLLCRRGRLLWLPAHDGGALRVHDLAALAPSAGAAAHAPAARHSIHYGAVSPDGRYAYVPQSEAGVVFRVDLTDGTLRAWPAPLAHHVHAAATDGERLFVAEVDLGQPAAAARGWLVTMRLPELELVYREPLAVTGHQALVDAARGRLWLTSNEGELLGFELASGQLIDSFPIGGSLHGLALVAAAAGGSLPPEPNHRPCLEAIMPVGPEER